MIFEKMKKLLNHFNFNDKKKLSILLTILISLELIQILIISLIFRKIFILIICIEILVHYLFLYLIIHKLLFSGSSTLITKYNCWCLGVDISKIFGAKLEDFKNSFDDFYSNNEKKYSKFNLNELYSKSEKLNSVNDLVSSYLKLSNTVEEKKMSYYQKDMVVSLNKLKMIIDESKLVKIVSETIINVFQNKEPNIYSIDLDNAIEKIKTQINIILQKIKNFQLENNIFKNTINFLFNDTFGSLIQLKNEILSRYYCESFRVNINDNKNIIDCLLIKNKGLIHKSNINFEKKQTETILDEEEDQKDVEQIIELEDEKEKELKEKNKQREENNKSTVIIICNKSLYPYELSAYYDKWVDYYLSLGINVILWNYRGYGSSNGSPSLKNIQKDAEQLIKYIKKIYSFNNIGVHGINIGGLVASYLCSQNLVNFCFVDRGFNSLYDFMNESCFKYFSYLFKITFIKDCNLSLLLNQNLKNYNIYKVISYSIKKDFIGHKISVKNMIANDFISKILNKNETLLKTILYNGGNKFEYDFFIKNLFYIIEKIINLINSTDIKDNDINQDQENNNIYETLKEKIIVDNNENINKNNNSNSDLSLDKVPTDSISTKNQDMKILNSIKQIFEKFDAGGETLLSLYSNKINNNKKRNITLLNKEEILNNFLTNLFSWGSYKIGKEYATELLVAYKAVQKKFSYVNRRISKILSDPKKYTINDNNISLALKNTLENFEKIEGFFNDKFIYKEINYCNLNKEKCADSSNNSFYSNKSGESDRININDVLNKKFLEDNSKIADFIRNLNIGNLLILDCENDKQYSDEEIKMLTLFLINSNFIK